MGPTPISSNRGRQRSSGPLRRAWAAGNERAWAERPEREPTQGLGSWGEAPPPLQLDVEDGDRTEARS